MPSRFYVFVHCEQGVDGSLLHASSLHKNNSADRHHEQGAGGFLRPRARWVCGGGSLTHASSLHEKGAADRHGKQGVWGLGFSAACFEPAREQCHG